MEALKSKVFEMHKNVIEHNNLKFYVIENESTLKIEHLIDYNAIILEAIDHDFTRTILKKFRAHSNPNFYLKPIFLLNSKIQNDPFIEQLHDGILLSADQIPEKSNEVHDIESRVTHLDNEPGSTFEIQLFKKILNYLYTRESRNIKPYTYVHSSIGYTYPIVSVNFELFEEYRVLEILSWAEAENLIWPDFIDRAYFCNNCKAGHLSYREVCPTCDSANMKSQDLVHHFPCGYIGPISDFKNNIDSTLNCPKCSKNLRHIGVDYDKPSLINHCQNCNEVFQDYLVKAKCVHCDQDGDVQYLLSKDINSYKLTKKGRYAATSGIMGKMTEQEDEIFGSVNSKTFFTMMYYESERMKHNNAFRANIAALQLENIFDLTRKLGKSREKAFYTELVHIIRENIRSTDFINISNPSMIFICMIDTELTTSNYYVGKICEKLKELVVNNFNGFELITEFRVESLRKDISFEKQMKELSKYLVESHD
ncbi:MAG TPA: hypothetical protein PLU73_00655 [Bacteroidia bacterium]|nr:hypothetical protein [Bacteroidia bacterium]